MAGAGRAARKERIRWLERSAKRQSNILPLDLARNEGALYGALLRGGRPLTWVQRLGTLVLGIMPLCVAVMALSALLTDPPEQAFTSAWPIAGLLLRWFVNVVVCTIIIALLFFGLRITTNAITAPKAD
jgi:hypothetical protein